MCTEDKPTTFSTHTPTPSQEQSFHLSFVELHDNFIDFLSWRESDTVDGQNAVTDGAVHGMQTAAGPARAESGGGKQP